MLTKCKTKVLNLSLNLDLSPFVKSAPGLQVSKGNENKTKCEDLVSPSKGCHCIHLFEVYTVPCRTFGTTLLFLFIWVLPRFQHIVCYIMRGSFKGRGNQYILVGPDSALYTAGHRKAITFPHRVQS